MRLTALEIKKKEFQQKMRGCDPDEVQAFLDKAAEEVELLTREKKESEEQLAGVRQRLDHYLSLESTLERTLVAAQQTAVKMEEQAKREAELILRDAQLERDRKLNDVRIDLDRAERELARLRSEYDTTLARMRSLLSGFTTFVAALEEERKVPSNAEISSSTTSASLSSMPLSGAPAPTLSTPEPTGAPLTTYSELSSFRP